MGRFDIWCLIFDVWYLMFDILVVFMVVMVIIFGIDIDYDMIWLLNIYSLREIMELFVFVASYNKIK